jgi:hypothetical protein
MLILGTIPQSIEDVIPRIDRGYRMDSPDGCPDEIYRIMKSCWREDPSQRPNFTLIDVQLRSKFLSSFSPFPKF